MDYIGLPACRRIKELSGKYSLNLLLTNFDKTDGNFKETCASEKEKLDKIYKGDVYFNVIVWLEMHVESFTFICIHLQGGSG